MLTKGERAERDGIIESLLALGLPFEKDSSVHTYRLRTKRGLLTYYPKSQKWQYLGKMHKGTPVAMQEFLVSNKIEVGDYASVDD